ncbi:MAG: histidine kinase dimerization/phospho-acceptor domain-containing protein, partial [Bacteroidales bacterium]
MKKSTIWLIAFVMGASFLALLYMQTRYLAEVIEIRKEQFDESVRHSLYLVARNLELRETRAGLEAELKTQGHAAGEALGKAQSEPAAMHQGADELSLPADSNVTVPQKFFFAKRRRLPVDEAFRDSVRQRYIYQRGLLDEVVYDILYETNEKPLAERIDFSLMDHDLRTSLKRNGIDIDYHFYVTTSDGREIYRCSDYTAEGEDFTYKQVLYPNDTQAQMGLLYIHFPEMQKYIFSSVRFIIPAIVFTLVLLIAFIFTIYTIFRQKRLTEIKNDFINNMTHEFKTPISTISLAAQMLGDGSVTKSESMLKHLSGIIVD